MALTPTVIVNDSHRCRKMQRWRVRTGVRHRIIDTLQYSPENSLVTKDLLYYREIGRHDCRNSEKCIFNQPMVFLRCMTYLILLHQSSIVLPYDRSVDHN